MTVGEYDFDGQPLGPMGAHPKIDPVTNELWFIDIAQPPYLRYTVVGAQGDMIVQNPSTFRPPR